MSYFSKICNLNSNKAGYIGKDSASPACAKRSGEGRRHASSALEGGFTLIEIVVVIIILSIIAAIGIKFLTDSLRVYTMTVNQKTLYDEGKLALERMCRDIRDASSITGTAATSVTFVRAHATAQDAAGETIMFRLNGTSLEKVKSGTGYAMASNVTAFTVAYATNAIQLTLTLSLTSGENVTLQTTVCPKNFPKDTTYKNFCQNWKEVKSPDSY